MSTFESDALPLFDEVRRFAESLTRNDADADDLAQETFWKAYRSWHTFRPGSRIRNWLFTVCWHSFLRGRARGRHHVALEQCDVEAVGHHEHWVSRVELAPALSYAIDRLPERYRSAVMLVDVEDHSYESAAAALGIPMGTVRSRLFRGRRLLREMLNSHAHDAGINISIRRNIPR